MITRETADALIVETEPKADAYKAPPRMPSRNMQRFEPGGRGPCVCSEAAILDKLTGLCVKCWRCLVFSP